MHRSVDQWVEYAKHQRKYIVFYEEKVIDVTEFIHIHPGGKKTLIPHIYKDVTDILFTIYKHQRESTLAALNKCVIGTLTPRRRLNSARHKTTLTPHKQKKKVCFEERQPEERENSSRPKRREEKSKTDISKRSQNKSNSKTTPVQKNKPTEKERKKNRFQVSIKLLGIGDDCVLEDQYQDWGSNNKTNNALSSPRLIQDDVDQEKPIFRVPILEIKHKNDLDVTQY